MSRLVRPPAGDEPWHILFVIDKGHLEDGLRRMLRGFEGHWALRFVRLEDGVNRRHVQWGDVCIVAVAGDSDRILEGARLWCKEHGSGRRPCLMVTGRRDADLKKRAMKLGVMDFLDKPLCPENLVSRISAALKYRAAVRERAEPGSESPEEGSFRALVETSVNAIAVVDPQNRLTYVNRAFLSMWGYSEPDEVLGRPVKEFWTRRHRATDILDTLQSKMNWRGDLEATRKDGTEFEAYVSAGMVRGQGWQPLCMMATFVDVTKEKESERELVRVRAALDGATDAIVMVDKDGKPVYANDAYRSIIGQSLAALESQGLASVYANTAEAERMLQTLQREGSWCGEIDLRTPAGGRLPMLLRGDSIRDGRGEVVGYMLVHTDIVERKIMEQQLSRRNRLLEDQVRQRTAELERARLDMVWRLARAGELRDECTGNHVVRVGFYCRLAGERLGLDADLLERIFITSPLHDIGKIGIPDGILLKPEALTPRERQTIESHCELGADILARDVMGNQSLLQAYSELNPLTRTPGYHALLATAAEIARNHHERWDGDGYPRGLAGEDIPISARIASVADVYDALVTERPYKEAFSHEEALAIIGEGRGTQFDPDVVDAFLAVGEEVYSVLRDLHD